MRFMSRLFGHKDTKPTDTGKDTKPTDVEKELWMEGDIGGTPHVRCREKGKAFGYTWTYKDGVIDKAKCEGCGKLFDLYNDEDHIPLFIS